MANIINISEEKQAEYPEIEMGRDAIIKRIRKALKERTGRTWSVKGGRGTSWGWISISAPPARRTWSYRLKEGMPDMPGNYEPYDAGASGYCMTPEDKKILAEALGFETCYDTGFNVPSSYDSHREFVDRAEGRVPRKIAESYLD